MQNGSFAKTFNGKNLICDVRGAVTDEYRLVYRELTGDQARENIYQAGRYLNALLKDVSGAAMVCVTTRDNIVAYKGLGATFQMHCEPTTVLVADYQPDIKHVNTIIYKDFTLSLQNMLLLSFVHIKYNLNKAELSSGTMLAAICDPRLYEYIMNFNYTPPSPRTELVDSFHGIKDDIDDFIEVGGGAAGAVTSTSSPAVLDAGDAAGDGSSSSSSAYASCDDNALEIVGDEAVDRDGKIVSVVDDDAASTAPPPSRFQVVGDANADDDLPKIPKVVSVSALTYDDNNRPYTPEPDSGDDGLYMRGSVLIASFGKRDQRDDALPEHRPVGNGTLDDDLKNRSMSDLAARADELAVQLQVAPTGGGAAGVDEDEQRFLEQSMVEFRGGAIPGPAKPEIDNKAFTKALIREGVIKEVLRTTEVSINDSARSVAPQCWLPK